MNKEEIQETLDSMMKMDDERALELFRKLSEKYLEVSKRLGSPVEEPYKSAVAFCSRITDSMLILVLNRVVSLDVIQLVLSSQMDGYASLQVILFVGLFLMGYDAAMQKYGSLFEVMEEEK